MLNCVGKGRCLNNIWSIQIFPKKCYTNNCQRRIFDQRKGKNGITVIIVGKYGNKNVIDILNISIIYEMY